MGMKAAGPAGTGSWRNAGAGDWVRALSADGAERERAAARLHEVLLRAAGRKPAAAAGSCGSPAPNSTTWRTRPRRTRFVASSPRSASSAARAGSPPGRTSSSSSRCPTSSGGISGASPGPDGGGGLGAAARQVRPRPGPGVRMARPGRALRRAVEEELTEHQRRVFTAIVLNGVPLDALVAELGPPATPSTRRCSTHDVSCGPASSLTDTCKRTR